MSTAPTSTAKVRELPTGETSMTASSLGPTPGRIHKATARQSSSPYAVPSSNACPPNASANLGQYVAYRCASGQAQRMTGSLAKASVSDATPRCRSAASMTSTVAAVISATSLSVGRRPYEAGASRQSRPACHPHTKREPRPNQSPPSVLLPRGCDTLAARRIRYRIGRRGGASANYAITPASPGVSRCVASLRWCG